MSLALADLLVELADPMKLEEFSIDQEGAMAAAGLTLTDKAALRSRNSGWIRCQAKENAAEVIDFIPGTNEETAGTLALDVIDVIDVVEVVAVV
jgi:hypothetical protein